MAISHSGASQMLDRVGLLLYSSIFIFAPISFVESDVCALDHLKCSGNLLCKCIVSYRRPAKSGGSPTAATSASMYCQCCEGNNTSNCSSAESNSQWTIYHTIAVDCFGWCLGPLSHLKWNLQIEDATKYFRFAAVQFLSEGTSNFCVMISFLHVPNFYYCF